MQLDRHHLSKKSSSRNGLCGDNAGHDRTRIKGKVRSSRLLGKVVACTTRLGYLN